MLQEIKKADTVSVEQIAHAWEDMRNRWECIACSHSKSFGKVIEVDLAGVFRVRLNTDDGWVVKGSGDIEKMVRLYNSLHE